MSPTDTASPDGAKRGAQGPAPPEAGATGTKPKATPRRKKRLGPVVIVACLLASGRGLRLVLVAAAVACTSSRHRVDEWAARSGASRNRDQVSWSDCRRPRQGRRHRGQGGSRRADGYSRAPGPVASGAGGGPKSRTRKRDGAGADCTEGERTNPRSTGAATHDQSSQGGIGADGTARCEAEQRESGSGRH